jgi:hypothetical protein
MDEAVEQRVREEISAIQHKLGNGYTACPVTFGFAIGDATPFIEYRDDVYHFVISERGTEFSRQTTPDLQELLYWIFEGVTFQMAAEWELRNRNPKQDSRRLLFSKQEELLYAIHHKWGDKTHEKHKQILQRHPFMDKD